MSYWSRLRLETSTSIRGVVVDLSRRPIRPSTHVRACLNQRGHTLIEVVFTLAVLLVISAMLLTMITEIERTWKTASTDPFTDAEAAFDTIGRNLAGATLASYPDYADASGAFRTNSIETFVPDHVARRSDLDFVCGPGSGTEGLLTASGRDTAGSAVFFARQQGYTQSYANAGMIHLLNSAGYFVEFGDEEEVPGFLPSTPGRLRWRLKQVCQPSEALQIYALTSSSQWVRALVAQGGSVCDMAENVITLLVQPERSAGDTNSPISADFQYDSRDATNTLTYNQLPPRLFVALVAIDEASAQLLASQNGTNAPVLVTAAPEDTDLSALDSSLTAQKIGHRIFQRTVTLSSAAWSNSLSP